MATDTRLNEFVVNKLTKAQYQAAQAAGTIVDTELYMITDDNGVVSESLYGATLPSSAPKGQIFFKKVVE